MIVGGRVSWCWWTWAHLNTLLCPSVHVRAHVCTCVCTDVRSCENLCTCVHKGAQPCTHVQKRAQVRMHMCAQVCTSVHKAPEAFTCAGVPVRVMVWVEVCVGLSLTLG